MIKNNFFKNVIMQIKYFKNNCIVKYKIIKKRKKNGENLGLKDFLIEIGLINAKNNDRIQKYPKNKSNVNKRTLERNQKDNKTKDTKHIFNKDTITTVLVSSALIIGSFAISREIFYNTSQIQFYNITQENENRILNILKSPKTRANIEIANINNDTKQFEYYFNVVDRLDAYSYKIRLNNISKELKNELLQNNYNNSKEIVSLKDITPKTIVLHNDYYLINNKYKIEEDKVSKSTLENIEKNIKQDNITQFNNHKNFKISTVTLILALILNSFYILIKKVISKK